MTAAADRFDVIVIGAGIAGAALAYFASPHARVLLLERESHPGMHSTGRSAAMFMQSYGPPQVRALTRASRAFFEQPPPGFGAAPLVRPRGALFIGSAAQRNQVEALYRTLRAEGCAAQQVHSRAGRWRAPAVVNAAGAWVDEIAHLAGASGVGIEARRRSAFVFEPPAGLAVEAWPCVAAIDESFYFKPDAGLLLGSPANADPVPPHDVMPEEIDIALAIDRIEAATTLRIRRPRRSWAGLRSFVADGEIVAGPDPAQPGFFWAAALGGYGIQTSPALGALGAAMVTGQAMPAWLLGHGVDAQRMAALATRCARAPGV